jgi:CRP-like cAMP-binding protein
MYAHSRSGNTSKWLQATYTRPSHRTEEQLEILAQHFKQSGLFGHLGLIPEHLARAVYSQTNTDIGSVICKPGETGACYFLIKGTAAVTPLDKSIQKVQLKKGESFGPMAEHQIDGAEFAEVTNCSCSTEILYVNVLDFNARLLKETIKHLGSLDMFHDWSRARLTKLANMTTHRVYETGEIVVQEGDFIDGVFIVESGALAVQKDVHVIRRNRWPKGGSPPRWEVLETHSDQALRISKLTPGGVFGENASFEKNWRTARRTATVCAISKSQLLYIPQQNFHNFLMTSRRLVDFLMAKQSGYVKNDKLQSDKIKKSFRVNEDTDTVIFGTEREVYSARSSALDGGPRSRARLMSADVRYGKQRPSSGLNKRGQQNTAEGWCGTMVSTFTSNKPKMKYRADSPVVAMLHSEDMPKLRAKLRATRKGMGRTAAWAIPRGSPHAAHFTI